MSGRESAAGDSGLITGGASADMGTTAERILEVSTRSNVGITSLHKQLETLREGHIKNFAELSAQLRELSLSLATGGIATRAWVCTECSAAKETPETEKDIRALVAGKRGAIFAYNGIFTATTASFAARLPTAKGLMNEGTRQYAEAMKDVLFATSGLALINQRVFTFCKEREAAGQKAILRVHEHALGGSLGNVQNVIRQEDEENTGADITWVNLFPDYETAAAAVKKDFSTQQNIKQEARTRKANKDNACTRTNKKARLGRVTSIARTCWLDESRDGRKRVKRHMMKRVTVKQDWIDRLGGAATAWIRGVYFEIEKPGKEEELNGLGDFADKDHPWNIPEMQKYPASAIVNGSLVVVSENLRETIEDIGKKNKAAFGECVRKFKSMNVTFTCVKTVQTAMCDGEPSGARRNCVSVSTTSGLKPKVTELVESSDDEGEGRRSKVARTEPAGMGTPSAVSTDMNKKRGRTKKRAVILEATNVDTVPEGKTEDDEPFLVPVHEDINCLELAAELMVQYGDADNIDIVLGSAKGSLKALCVIAAGIRRIISSGETNIATPIEAAALGELGYVPMGTKKNVEGATWCYTEHNKERVNCLEAMRILQWAEFESMQKTGIREVGTAIEKLGKKDATVQAESVGATGGTAETGSKAKYPFAEC